MNKKVTKNFAEQNKEVHGDVTRTLHFLHESPIQLINLSSQKKKDKKVKAV